MIVAIIENSDDPEEAQFLTDSRGIRLLFGSYESAEGWLMKNAIQGICYAKWGDD